MKVRDAIKVLQQHDQDAELVTWENITRAWFFESEEDKANGLNRVYVGEGPDWDESYEYKEYTS